MTTTTDTTETAPAPSEAPSETGPGAERLTAERIAELRELLGEMTEGEFFVSDRGIGYEVFVTIPSGLRLRLNQGFRETFTKPDAEMIAGLLNAAPALLNAAEEAGRLREENAALTRLFRIEPIPADMGGGYCARFVEGGAAFHGDGETPEEAVDSLNRTIASVVDDFWAENKRLTTENKDLCEELRKANHIVEIACKGILAKLSAIQPANEQERREIDIAIKAIEGDANASVEFLKMLRAFKESGASGDGTN